jgi:leader peptidase (prepilin peptidase) / N-methyltransferase
VTWFLDTALVAGAVGLVTGALVPSLIARIPEPDERALDEAVEQPVEDGTGRPAEEAAEPILQEASDRPRHRAAAGDERDLAVPARPLSPGASEPSGSPDASVPPEPLVEEPKQLYVDIAAGRGLRWRTSVATGLVAGLLGARLGWQPALVIALYLAPVGVALAVVDWRTRLLPTKVIAPSYGVVAALAVLCAAVDGDRHALVTAALGWLVAGGTFFVLWFVYPRGMGYGDVRLSGVLGIALGYLGWAELVTGVYSAFLIGGVGGLLLSVLRLVDRKAYPFGPFMLVGAVVGVLAGPAVAAFYA